MKKFLIISVLALALFSCNKENKMSKGKETQINLIEVPINTVSSQTPNFFSNNENLYLSWIETESTENSETNFLKFALLKNNRWQNPQTISKGNNWFVNWADFPTLAVSPDGWMASHWLAKSNEGTYDYNVNISVSDSGGVNWKTPFIPHIDTLPAEYGFVSMMPQKDKMMAVWLDGRFTKDDSVANGGAMTLRTAAFDSTGTISDEMLLDDRICDCCQTDLTQSDLGTFVVYRDRTENEIRDIYFMKKTGRKWSKPKAVFTDKWKISGCPVNGPAIASLNKSVAVSWFSAPEGEAKVKVAFFNEKGNAFEPPFIISEHQPLGRVDVVLVNENTAWVSWLETKGDNASIKLAEVDRENGVLWQTDLIDTSAARSSGFPIMEKLGNNIWFTWTKVESPDIKKITTGYISLDNEI
ncbi:exo-alpha-sialidase [Chondrinema litorale]|uniref:exo-alpha-sialidase n=1 Tax=Chondrinema litorale TaxID=2994555 RepID=UPI0025432303|nr:exo-alpha-sialidase [Chondrinema litorale]UZR93019.1 exo-alpha-sialidase [Chondrinema litorale]